MTSTPYIKVELSDRIFCFYTLLNAGGYSQGHEVHPIRRRVVRAARERLTGEVTKVIEELLVKPGATQQYWFPYRTWVLCHGQPSEFSELSEKWKKILDENSGEKLRAVLQAIWSDFGISELWERERAEYLRAERQCEENARNAVQISMDYLRLRREEITFKNFVVIPNFLDEYHRGIGPLIENTAYALMGPSPDPNDPFPEERIQHEFLHSIINPVVGKIFHDSSHQEKSKLRETLIHGIVLKTHRNDQNYVRHKREDLIGKKINVVPVLKVFEEYENTGGSFEEFVKLEMQKIKEACR
ncbi:MAG: hypothetical protein HYU81_02670 [Candidatus Brennerbacteria bacterium]|nr:hypothetical protein [Candidatus Brennerbacteria bacterium]